MSNSGNLILGIHPEISSARTRGSLGINDAADPSYVLCTKGDTPGSLGVNDHGAPFPKTKVNDPVDIEIGTHSGESPEVKTPWVVFQVKYTYSPVLLSSESSSSKIRIDLEKYKIEYEKKLAKLSENIQLKVKGSADGKQLLDGFVKTVLERDPKHILAALQAGISAEFAAENPDIPKFEVGLVIGELPIEIAIKGTYSWFPGVHLKTQISWRFTIKLCMRPGVEAWRQLAKSSANSVVEFLNIYCRALIIELVQAGILQVTALVSLAAGLTFAFTAMLAYKIDSQFKAGAVLAFCIEYAEAYVLAIYGRTRKGHSKLAPVSDSSSPDEILQCRKMAQQDALDAARKYAYSLSPGTPWSDAFLLKMFREHYGVKKNKEEYEARQLMYEEVLAGIRKTKGV